jgi:hypothetical protein
VAQKVTLVDDIDGNAADETVSFSLDGVSYEVDLNKSNAKKLRDALAPYASAGRRVGGRAARGRATARRGRGAAGSASSETAQIRAWAKSKGIKVSSRGRIPASVIERYRASR